MLGSNGSGQRLFGLTTPQEDRRVNDRNGSNVARSAVTTTALNTTGFGDFVEEERNSSSIAAAKIARELGNTNETTIATTNKHGVKLVTRPTTSVANRLGYTGEHGLSNASIRESPWDLDAMTARPTLVETVSWTNTSAITTFNMPYDLLVSKFMSVPFLSFKFWRSDIILQFQVNASPLYQGCMMVSYVPMVDKARMWPASIDRRSWFSMNQSMYIYANTNTVAEMRIPFFHPKGYLTTGKTYDAENNMGLLVMTPLNPLLSVTTTPAVVNISIYMHLENAEFKVPLPNSEILDGPISNARSLRGPSRLRAQGATSSKIINNWSHVSGSSMTTKTEGDKVDAKADIQIPMEAAAAMDNPSFTVMLPNLTVKGVGHASAATGCEYLEKLSIYPGALSTASFETFGTDIDEMMISNIKQRYTYMTSFDITPADASGTKKIALPMAPVVGTYKLSTGAPYPLGTMIQAAANPMFMPLISYISIPFTTWSGGITYKFQFVASSMHTCKIFVGLHYGVYDPSVLVDDLDFTGQYGVAYEINQGSNELEVTAPYIASTPYLYIPRTQYDKHGVMGTMTFSIVNALASPSSVFQSISVNVFMAGASDFRLNGLNVNLPFKLESKTLTLRAQSSVAPTNIAPTVTSIAQDDMAGPDQVFENIRDEHFCRDISSIRDTLRRYQFITKRSIAFITNTTTFSISQSAFLRIDPWWLLGIMPCLNRDEFNPAVPNQSLPDLGLLTWFTSMYGLFRGSLRFKIFVRPLVNSVGPAGTGNIVSSTPVSWRVLFVPPTSHVPAQSPFVEGDSINMDYQAIASAGLETLSGTPQDKTWTWATRAGSTIRSNFYTNQVTVVSMVSSPAVVAEFEIPYMSIYQSVPIKQFLPTVYDLTFERGLGSIYVCLDFLTDKIGTLSPWSGANVEVHMAFGDDTRLGNLNMIPLLTLNPMLNAMGTYFVSNWMADTGTAVVPPPPAVLRSSERRDIDKEKEKLEASDGDGIRLRRSSSRSSNHSSTAIAPIEDWLDKTKVKELIS